MQAENLDFFFQMWHFFPPSFFRRFWEYGEEGKLNQDGVGIGYAEKSNSMCISSSMNLEKLKRSIIWDGESSSQASFLGVSFFPFFSLDRNSLHEANLFFFSVNVLEHTRVHYEGNLFLTYMCFPFFNTFTY